MENMLGGIVSKLSQSHCCWYPSSWSPQDISNYNADYEIRRYSYVPHVGIWATSNVSVNEKKHVYVSVKTMQPGDVYSSKIDDPEYYCGLNARNTFSLGYVYSCY